MKRVSSKLLMALGITVATVVVPTQLMAKKPNILAIWGDDVGWFNISAYNRGMMGYKTPNIDKIADDGILFTDAYGQNSCTAGRAAFITGQSPLRTGLLKVGFPGAKEGLKGAFIDTLYKRSEDAAGNISHQKLSNLISKHRETALALGFTPEDMKRMDKITEVIAASGMKPEEVW